MSSIKSKPCKECGSVFHTAMYHKPRKPIKRTELKTSKVPKTKTSKKKKAPTRSQLVKKLDKVFSEWLRQSYADKDGMVICYTCGNRLHWKEIQNGHFFSRARQNTRWLPENCRPQDYRCNVALSGNYIIYTRKMLAEMGEEKLDEMEKLSRSTSKITTPQLKEMIDHYTKLTKGE